MKLRDYQLAAVDATYQFMAQGRGNPLVVAPTGSGKSLILSEFIRSALTDYPDTRIICATHVKELIQQNYHALMRLWPDAPAGIYSAGLNKRQVNRPITFAGIQSVAKRADEYGDIDLMIVDEAHLIPRKSATMYQRFIEGLKNTNPQLKIIGLTATPFRVDSGRLDQGQGAMFDGISYDIPITYLVEQGYLAPLVSKSPSIVFDTSGLRTRAGEWVESEMVQRFGTDKITQAAVQEIIQLGQDRKSWLIFCINVDHATAVRDVLIEHGIPTAVVTGATAAIDRQRILADYKAGRLRAITNVNVLSTGFDAPQTDLLAFLRPTQSLGLYLQMAGRAMRTAPGKENGLVLDYAGNVLRHGPVDAVQVLETPHQTKGTGEAPSKVCPNCKSILHAAVRECQDCGFEFPPPVPKIEKRASTAAIMNMTADENWQAVQDFIVCKHDPRDGRPVSLRAEYLVSNCCVKEWVCLEHSGFPRQKAVQWWQAYAGTTPPATVAEALDRQNEIRPPAEVVVRREGKYDRIYRARGHKKRNAA